MGTTAKELRSAVSGGVRGVLGLGKSLKAFLDNANAQTSDDVVYFKRRIETHLGADPTRFPIVSEKVGTPDHPNLQRALDVWLAQEGRSFELLGAVGEEYFSLTLANLLAAGRNPIIPAPVQYQNHTLHDGVLPCVATGIYFVKERDERVLILVYASKRGYADSIRLDVLARDQSMASRIHGELQGLMRAHNVYRGHVISLGVTDQRELSVRFHRLPRVERDKIILPEGLLGRIERLTTGITKNRERLLAAKRHLKRGLLLHGPPGTGKTLTGMYLATQMRERTVIIVTGRGMGLIGPSCAMARALEPSIVIIEDVDLIGQERGRNDCNTPILFDLLNEMDGLAEDVDVMFLLTTNRPDVLEPALSARPGRVDQAIEVPLPDGECRRRLLELYGQGLSLEVNDLARIVDRTEGASAAFMRELVRKAAVFAADTPGDRVVVNDGHFDDAVHELVVEGGELTKSLLGAHRARHLVAAAT